MTPSAINPAHLK